MEIKAKICGKSDMLNVKRFELSGTSLPGPPQGTVYMVPILSYIKFVKWER